ncbi:hypothetical protein LX95_01270 [Mesonia algae]|uniref:Uncharacterized protein n=1 Tax=Mesonia algae TaxID=213248 RepID=A0A2W7I5T6_9FLAO|nr:hypothetical protein [Mesonia algae]PZW41589.1 hypothetical protein LX95_01270 [Mesonia algae]
MVKAKDFKNKCKARKRRRHCSSRRALPLSIEDGRKVAIEATAENFCSTDYLNKDNYSNMAIIKVTLDLANENDVDSWKSKLENLDNKKTFYIYW